jgi:hypothetical protein
MQSLEASKYKNTLDCALQIMRNEGPLAWVDDEDIFVDSVFVFI